MPASDYLNSLAKQYETLNKLIEEAENTQNQEQSIKLYYKARSKTESLSKDLQETLDSEKQSPQRNAA